MTCSPRSTVSFTLGTVFNHRESGDLFSRAMAGLRELPIDLRVTVGREIDPAAFGLRPSHVRIERDYDDPAASEARFRTAIEAAEARGDPTAADEARTQLARALGLRGQFDEAYEALDRVDTDHPADDRIRVRARLERGRAWRSGGDVAASITPFEGAWELARALGEDELAVNAAHVLAIVNAPPGEAAWHERALELADTSPQPAARRWRGSLWNNIGWARLNAGDLDSALTAFETALGARLEQRQPQGDACRRVVRRALRSGARAARRGPGDPGAAGRGDGSSGGPGERLRGRGDRRVPARSRQSGGGSAVPRPCRRAPRCRSLARRARARSDRPAPAPGRRLAGTKFCPRRPPAVPRPHVATEHRVVCFDSGTENRPETKSAMACAARLALRLPGVWRLRQAGHAALRRVRDAAGGRDRAPAGEAVRASPPTPSVGPVFERRLVRSSLPASWASQHSPTEGTSKTPRAPLPLLRPLS